ncbi:nuclear transport factor 2 family protein [Defluviimonas sp. WL0050]|uniref:Nuclear transport factor 2 family protein n=1 Tax=Albidovulum litorale TaxID=2984134 RepID=A0ABT2ZQM3_9RHOB|nr:nuclear transport factor 2 family protein [Defluviimonas sp. WL0050]MCV2873459.1 nuclear transport factor 2 family protein [Defluviimonas sp. WL0050]
MALYQMLDKAMEARDAEAYIDLMHDDFTFVRHQSGETMGKAAMAEMVRRMMASDKMAVRDQRLIYENGDILVEHSVMDFPDGTSEAVMGVHTLKDGKILRTETGATLLKK